MQRRSGESLRSPPPPREHPKKKTKTHKHKSQGPLYGFFPPNFFYAIIFLEICNLLISICLHLLLLWRPNKKSSLLLPLPEHYLFLKSTSDCLISFVIILVSFCSCILWGLKDVFYSAMLAFKYFKAVLESLVGFSVWQQNNLSFSSSLWSQTASSKDCNVLFSKPLESTQSLDRVVMWPNGPQWLSSWKKWSQLQIMDFWMNLKVDVEVNVKNGSQRFLKYVLSWHSALEWSPPT